MSIRSIAATVAGLLALALALPAPVAADVIPDPTDPTAQFSVTKTVSTPGPVGPGDSFTYTIEIGCSAISDIGCRGAITTDAVPAPLVIDNVVPSGAAHDAATVNGQDISVTWTQDLDGTTGNVVGLLDNTTAQIEVTVHVPDDVSYDYNGTALTNSATAEATNAEDVTDTADVTINVPLELDTTATKSLDPTSALAAAGTAVTASLGGSNDSNATVDTLTIQDPVDPDVDPNPFTYLGFDGFGDVTAPDGTTGTTYEVYIDGAWVTCDDAACANVDPDDVQGTRVTFTGDIPAGATASVDVDLVTTDAAAGLTEDTTVTNDVSSEVDLDDQSATDNASADFDFQANNIDVTASKSFDPDVVVAGDSSTATIGGANTSPFPLDSMTITEPSTGSFPDEYTFGGFSTGITYPEGATSGTVVYQPSGETVSFVDGGIPAPPAGGVDSVTSFQIVFTGDIQPGAEASADASFDVETDADLTDLPTTVNNEVGVEGENDGATGEDTADDDLYIYDEVIEPYVDKQIRPSQIIANPGEIVTVSLKGGTTPRPTPPDQPDGTTGSADHIVIQDPQAPIQGDAWWNAFDLDSITQTPIPADAALTVYYYDTSDPTGGPAGDGWKVLTGPVDGPVASFSYAVPDAISAVAGGVRFDYEYTGTGDGFPPGTDLAPNFTSSLRATGRYDGAAPPYNNDDPDAPDTLIPDCASSTASSPDAGIPDGSAGMDPADCPEIDIIPTNGEGVGDLIDKAFGTSSDGGNKAVIARSGDTIPSTLSWSTGGYSGFETVDVTDIADPEGTAIADSVYDAFNLIRVAAITDGEDPYLKYDQITGVQLWNGTDWVDATNDPCPAGCDGAFPGMDLTAAEQLSTESVRLTYAESPTRAATAAGDLDAPPVGSGVARSIGNNRHLTLLWQIRDDKRSDGSPVLAEDLYNQPDPGVVRNTVNATGYPADGADPVSDNASDDVVITDVPITGDTTKVWTGGPLAIPEPGTPADQYPLSQIAVTTTNTTPAMLDQLQITDPAPGSTSDPQTDPFDYFTLNDFAAIDEPAGTTSTTVTVTCLDGTDNTYTRADALALNPGTMPCDTGSNVATVRVLFDGRIDSNASGVLRMDLRLRASERESGAAITTDDSPIVNTAEGVVADVDAIQDCPAPTGARYDCDDDAATIQLQEPTYDIVADKSISPATQKEGDDSPVTVTIGEQSSGTARPYIEQLTDEDPTFWNAVDFLRVDPSWTLPQPVEFVQACYKTGGTFTDATVGTGSAAAVGGTWTCEPLPPGGPPYQPGQLTLQNAQDFLAGAPAGDVHGLRFRFMAGNEIGWQNPSHPHIQVPFQVQRRVDLRTGEPVPTTRSDQSPAPGETEAGVFNDTVRAEGQTVLVGAGGDGRLHASDTAVAPYTYQHLTVGVTVDKSPTGQVDPGTVIPFKLTYTNTGEAPLTDPVFTDVLPSDADGNQLIFDPDADPAASPYSFELTGPAPTPPNGDPLPTDQDDITITESGDTITFAMPDGTVLEPGQTYVITIDLMLRPGLTPDDVVTNTDIINVDEPFDAGACAPNYGPDAQHTDAVYDGACWDDTDVSPVRVAALSTVKKVKADVPVEESGIPEIYLDPELGAGLPDDYCDTAADADGFYRAPCVPVTYPGDTETWRYTITNTGTLPLDQVTSVDSLPHVGDTGVIVTLPRDSEWNPTFADSLELVDDAGTGATLTVLYSTSYNPCTQLLTGPLEPGAADCEDADWQPYTAGTDPTTVHSLATRLDFPDGSLFQPGDSVVLQAKTTTTPTDRSDSTYPIAWNTVATGGVADDNGTRKPVPATEGRKVGVTYPVGPIQLEKTVSGPGAQYAPDSFTVQPTCTVPPDDTPVGNIDPVTLVPGDDPVQVDGLPWGATCTATETDQGQTSQTIGTATVGGPDDDIGLVSIDNDFELGDMSVTKSVDSAAVDQDGNPIGYGPFQVEVSCTFLGQDVFAAGYDADNPMILTIEDGETVTLTDLPIGAECTTTEPDNADAASVVFTPQTVTIGGADKDPGDVEAVTVTNHYEVGSLQLTKEVDGDALQNDPDLVDGPFTLHVTCTLIDASHPDGEVVYDDDVTLTGVAPDNTATIDDLATGASCDVTEPDTGGATTHTVTPSPVTIGSGTTVQVTATNTFTAGSMAVTKAVDTDAVDQDGNPIGYGPFQVDVACSFEGDDVYGTGFGPGDPMTHSIDAGETWQIDGLPVGAQCTTAESDDADAVSVDIAPATLTIGGDDADPADVEAVTVTNHYDVGSLHLVKEVDGDALDNNPAIGEGPFTLHVACTLTDASHDGTTVYDGDVVLEGEQPLEATIDDLPTGALCDITETDDNGATDTAIDGSPATIGGPGDDPVTVTATNTFDAGDMAVTKTVSSDAVDQDGDPVTYGPFEVHVTCTFQGDAVYATGYSADDPMTFEIAAGDTVTLEDLPVGSVCVTTEPDDADAADVAVAPRTVTIAGPQQPVVAVTVTNSYDVGSLHLRKFVTPAAVQDFPISEGPFTLHVACTLTDASHPDGELVYDDDVVLEGPQPLEATIDDVAAGAVCTVTEPDPGDATAHVITPKTITIRADRTVNVVATNLFAGGALTITKTMDGPGAARYGAGPFEVSLECTYTDINGDQQPLNTPGGATRELSADNDYTATYDPLLFGSTCHIEETRTGGATTSVITDADGNEVSDLTVDSLTEDLQLNVTNTFDVGRVKVHKVVQGDGDGPYTVKLACTYDVDGKTTKVDIPGDAERTLTEHNHLTAVYDDLPASAACALIETDDGGASRTTITPNDGDPAVGSVLVEDGATVKLRVVNVFPDEEPQGTGPTQGGQLPGAGASRWTSYLLIGGLLALIAGGALVVVGRRRRPA